MNKRNTYFISLLALFLSLSLVLPVCCHAGMMNASQPGDKISVQEKGHAHPAHHQCECGHDLVKDYQKNKKVTAGKMFSLSAASAVIKTAISPPSLYQASTRPLIRPEIYADSGPPLHLLNSVFLN